MKIIINEKNVGIRVIDTDFCNNRTSKYVLLAYEQSKDNQNRFLFDLYS